jgi:hypothetical protein
MNAYDHARWVRGRASLLALGLLFGWGCTLDRPGSVDPVGPSDAGVSVDLNASPDTVNADGVSTSYVRLVLRNNRGEPLPGHPVLFAHDGDGYLSPSPLSNYVGPVQTGLVMATDRNGVADVVYTAGTGVGCLRIFVRPYGTDTNLTLFNRQVEICQL